MELRGKSFAWIAAIPILTLLAVGCTTPGTGQTSAINRDREKDALDRADKALGNATDSTDTSSSKMTARSQAPTLPAPANPPSQILPTSALETAPALEVRIVANVSNNPVYDREVKEAVAWRFREYLELRGEPRKAKEQQIYREELKRIIERELIIEELISKLKKSGNDKGLNELQKAASQEADKRLKEFRKEHKIETEEELAKQFEMIGISLNGFRRQLERSWIRDIYLQEMIKPKMNNVSLAEVHDYYDRNPSEFKIEDSVKWYDLFISASPYANRADAKRDAENLLTKIKAGANFVELVKAYDKGDSKFRDGQGSGTKRGEIRPNACEETLFSLKAGESKIVEIESGFHIVKVTERNYAGIQPLNEKVQLEIRERLRQQCREREFRRLIDDLWRKAQPQILIDK